MIEVLNSKRMTVVIIILIIICTIIVLIEEWFTNSQLVISSLLTTTGDSSNRQHQLPSISNNNIYYPTHPDENSPHQHLEPRPIVQPPTIEQSSTTFASPHDHIHWKQFLSFFSLVSFFGGISGLGVKYREQQMRTRSLSRFRKQANSEDSSNHTLINMNSLM